MKRIWKVLRYIWDVWIPHRDRLDPGVMVAVRSANAKSNEIFDEWLKENKGQPITPEALEEYQRRVLESVHERARKP